MLFSVVSEVAQHRHLFLLLSKYRDVVGWSTTWKPNSVLCIYLSDLTTHFLKVPESVPDCFSHFKPSHFKSSINTQHNDVNMKCNFRGIICTNIQNCLRRHNHVPVCLFLYFFWWAIGSLCHLLPHGEENLSSIWLHWTVRLCIFQLWIFRKSWWKQPTWSHLLRSWVAMWQLSLAGIYLWLHPTSS